MNTPIYETTEPCSECGSTSITRKFQMNICTECRIARGAKNSPPMKAITEIATAIGNFTFKAKA